MREVRAIMGMPIEVEIVGSTESALNSVFSYFTAVDERFSTYKETSEISQINRGEITDKEWSKEMSEVFELARETSRQTDGYFSILRPDGDLDPSGIVKGWAIRNAAAIAMRMGYNNYFINAGGDIQSSGVDESGASWTIGIRNPFKKEEIIKVLRPAGKGVATSGSYIRGDHIYNPHEPQKKVGDIVSVTVIGPDVYEADRFATAAFAMGKSGIAFIEQTPGLEGYVIDQNGIATMTSGFEAYTT